MTAAGPPREFNRFDHDLGIWLRVPSVAPATTRAALFLDRDGVVVEDPGYLSRAADVVLIAGSATVIALANRRGVPVVEVSNQAGIGRGYYGWEDFLQVEETLTRELAGAGARIDAVLACPYHRDGVPPWSHPAHPARKPRPGMLLAAARLLHLDLKRSWIVGDKLGDLAAGFHAGLAGGLHVLTGEGPQHRASISAWRPDGFEVRCGQSILDAGSLVDLLA